MSDKQIESIILRVPMSDPNYDELINVIIPSLRESENNKWTCPYCSRNAHYNANYSSYFAFTRHLAQRHRDCLPLDGDIFGYVSSFKCIVCDKEFSRNDHYKTHLKSITHMRNEVIFKKQNETTDDRIKNRNENENNSSDKEENERLDDLLKERGKRARNLQQSQPTLKFEPLNLNQQASQSSKRRRNYEYEKNYEINSPVDDDFSLPNLDHIQSTPISKRSAKKFCFNKQQDDDILEAINAYYYNDESNESIPSAQISKYDVSKRSSYFEDFENQSIDISIFDSIKQEITNEQPNRAAKRKYDDDDDDDQMLAKFISQNKDEQLRTYEPILQKDEDEDHLLNAWISQNVMKFKYLQPVRSNNDSNNNVVATQQLTNESDDVKINKSKLNKKVRFN